MNIGKNLNWYGVSYALNVDYKGKKAIKIIFWYGVSYALKVPSLLIKKMILIDSDKRPAMDYSYNAISDAFGGKYARFHIMDAI